MNNLFPYKRYCFDNEDLLKGLPEYIYKILNRNQSILYFNKQQSIFNEGAIPKGLFLVKTGKIKKHTATNFIKDHVFYICREEEYFGYHALLSDEPYSDSATAITDCQVIYIPKSDFFEAIENSHELSKRILKTLSHEFGVYINATKILAKHTVRERVAINLLILNERLKIKGINDDNVVIDLSREDLASIIGTTKESLVRTLQDFNEEGHITKKGRQIQVKNIEGLKKISNYK